MRTEMPWRIASPSDYAFLADGEVPIEYGSTGSSYVPEHSSRHDVFPGLDEYVATGWSKGLDTWQCSYCGSKYWIEDRQLQCSKCGGPRDV